MFNYFLSKFKQRTYAQQLAYLHEQSKQNALVHMLAAHHEKSTAEMYIQQVGMLAEMMKEEGNV